MSRMVARVVVEREWPSGFEQSMLRVRVEGSGLVVRFLVRVWMVVRFFVRVWMAVEF